MKSTRFTERLNFEKELKSTVWGREFQQLITRSLKKLARTQICWKYNERDSQLIAACKTLPPYRSKEVCTQQKIAT